MNKNYPVKLNNRKLKVAFIGGTERALVTFAEFLKFKDIEVVFAVFMPGYENERPFSERLSLLARKTTVAHIVSDKIDSEIEGRIKLAAPDVLIGGGIWRSMLSESILRLAPFGYIGLHGTGLPEYRGFAGINWQIINGEKQIIMRMFQLGLGVDNGPLVADRSGRVLEYKIDIDNEKHLGEILEEYQELHIKSYRDLFQLILEDNISFIPQDESSASYACHRGPQDSEIEWKDSSEKVFNLIRSQAPPYAGAYTYFKGRRVIVIRSRLRADFSNYSGRIPGKVVARDRVSGHVFILTGDSAIEVCEARIDGCLPERPYVIFNSVRERCKTKVEAAADLLLD